MKRRLFVLASLLGLFLSPNLWAQTTTYTYTGSVRTAFANFTSPCAIAPCANFAPGSKLTGQFTTAAPLASNLAFGNILPQVTSYSFTDGLYTYSSADPNMRAYVFGVSTNASGNLVTVGINLQLWQTGSSPHVAGNRWANAVIGTTQDESFNNQFCTTTGASPVTSVVDACTAGGSDASTSDGAALVAGTWVTSSGPPPPAAAPVATPTLSFWAMVLLSLITVALAFHALRKRA